MRPNPAFELTDREVIARLVRENPWATLVSATSQGLVASHYPVLLDETREALSILTHVGRPDERLHELGEHELLAIVQGPHGYVSSSWYGEGPAVPTWNFIVAHLSGVPELLGAEENLEVLARLVDAFEGRVAQPRHLDASPAERDHAIQLSRGTVGVRLTPTRILAKRKMSQNQEPQIAAAVLAELEGDGPYANPALAREMRLAHGAPGTAAAGPGSG